MNDAHPGADALSPGEMLRLAETERSRAAARITPDDRLIYGIWAVAWGVGFLALWLVTGDRPRLDQGPAAGVLFAVLIGAGVVATLVHVGRRVAGVHGPSEVLGRRHGTAWFVAFAGYGALMAGLGRAGITDEQAELLGPLLACLLVALLYLAGGAAWDDALQFRLGVWIAACVAVAALIGSPGHLLVMAVGGGGGYLVAAVLAGRRRAA